MRLCRTLLLTTASIAAPVCAQSVPVEPQVLGGEASFSVNDTGTVRTVNQTSQKLFLDWTTLDVPDGHVLQFVQPDSASIALNRVTGASQTVIGGSIEGNGQIWILNPNGVLIAPTGQVTSAGFLASTANLSHTDFLASNGAFRFTSSSPAEIANFGTITTDLGYTILHAARISNLSSAVSVSSGGTIQSHLGAVLLASGSDLSVSFDQGQLISFSVSHNPSFSGFSNSIFNNGMIRADGGLIAVEMATALGAIAGVVNIGGLVEANAIGERNGQILLSAGRTGTLTIEGTVTSPGNDADEEGGLVRLHGGSISIANGAQVRADGMAGGGTVTAWADPLALGELAFQPFNPFPVSSPSDPLLINASAPSPPLTLSNGVVASVSVHAGAVMSANATQSGKGGLVFVEANPQLGLGARIAGSLQANAAGEEQSGGFVELKAFYLDVEGASLEAVASDPMAEPGNIFLSAASFELVDQIATQPTDVLAWQPGNGQPLYDPSLLQSLDLSDDQVSQPIPIGFDFVYFGKSFSTVEVSSNGIMSFESLFQNSFCCSGEPLGLAGPAASVFGLWTDLAPHYDVNNPGNAISPTGNPRYGTIVLPDGSREFILQWNAVSEFFNGELNTFEIRLRENGEIFLNYGDVSITQHSIAAGLKGRAASQVFQYLYQPADFSNSTNVAAPLAQTSATFRQPSVVSELSAATIQSTLDNGSSLLIIAQDFLGENAASQKIGSIGVRGPMAFQGAQQPIGAASATFDPFGPRQGLVLRADKSIAMAGPIGLTGSPLSLEILSDANGDGIGTDILLSSITGAGWIDITGNMLLNETTEIHSFGDIRLEGNLSGGSSPNPVSLLMNAGGVLTVTGQIGTGSDLSRIDLLAESVFLQSADAGLGELRIDTLLGGQISGSIAAGHLIKTGPGALELLGQNQGLVDFSIDQGMVLTSSDLNLGSGSLVVNDATIRITDKGTGVFSKAVSVIDRLLLAFNGSGEVQSSINGLGSGSGQVTVEAEGDLLLAGSMGTDLPLDGVFAISGGRLTLGENSRFVADGFIDLAGSTGFTNLALSQDVLSAGLGWAIWSGNPDPFGGSQPDQVGNLRHDWRFYGISEDQVRGLAPLPERPVGNGFAYSLSPVLTVAVTNSISKEYDGTTGLSPQAVTLAFNGLINDDLLSGVTIGAIAFDDPSVSATSATITGVNADFVDSSGKPVFGYRFDQQLVVPATILPRALGVALTGSVSRDYDGTLAALLGSGNFALTGLVAGETIEVTQTAGAFASKDTGTGIRVTAQLSLGDFAAGSGTSLANYALPTSATGLIGTILPRALGVALTGSVSRDYDGTLAALLGSGNFALTGLVAGETIEVTQTSGAFASKDAGTGIRVTAQLSLGDFAAGSGTSLANYALPTSATGLIGTIRPLTLVYRSDSAKRFVGAPNPPFTGTVTGFIPGEGLANATTGQLAFTSPADGSSAPGRYAINGGGLTARNYVFRQAEANATALTVEANIVNQVAAASSAGGGATSPAPSQGAATASTTETTSGSTTTSEAAPADSNAGPANDTASTDSDTGGDAGSEPQASDASEEPAAPEEQAASSDPVASSEGSDSQAPAGAPSSEADSSGSGSNDPGASSSQDSGSASSEAAPVAVEIAVVDAAAAEPLPASPVAEEPTPVPADPEDGSDPVLASVDSGSNENSSQSAGTAPVTVALTPSISFTSKPVDTRVTTRGQNSFSIYIAN